MTQIVTDETFLRKECERVDEDEFQFLHEKLKTSLLQYNAENPQANGVGLAAPQIGINKRAFFVQNNNFELFMANPEIIDAYDFSQIKEGCLSVPGRQISVERNAHIYVKSDNHPEGMILSGINATIVQHEMDHLDGTLIIDKLQTLVKKDKMGRNDPCHCGSGKKFKRCCMNN